MIIVRIAHFNSLHNVTDSSICEKDSLNLQEKLIICVIADNIENTQQDNQNDNEHCEDDDPVVFDLRWMSQQVQEAVEHFAERIILFLGGAGHRTGC
jgi:hypothetical protein